VEIEGDLRAVFYLDGDMVVTLDIGTHAIYGRCEPECYPKFANVLQCD
jgi:hypothetical protein